MTSLNISWNSFDGDIPTIMGNLTSLASLDMSNNYFHGSIPSSFNELISLTTLILKNNELSDSIPTTFNNEFLSLITICEIASGNSFCRIDHQIFPLGCVPDLNVLPLCFPTSTIWTNSKPSDNVTPDSSSSSSPTINPLIIIIVIVIVVIVLLSIIATMILYKIRRQRGQLLKHEYLKMSMAAMMNDSIKSSDLLKTVTNETIIKFGPTFSMPGHLMFTLAENFRIIHDIGEGGGGSIKLAEMLTLPQEVKDVDLKKKNVVLKFIKSGDESKENSNDELNARAVWQQEICIMW